MDIFDARATGGSVSTDPTGTMPHLLQHLWAAYRTWIENQLAERRKAGQSVTDLETALKRAPASSFVTFAAGYLAENRIHEVFQLDTNCGVRLTNNAVVMILPAAAGNGSEAGDGATTPWRAVAVTPELSNRRGIDFEFPRS